jgi:hypothetical protein
MAEKTTQRALVNVFGGIMTRCYNANHPRFHRYGGRGIKVCDEWLQNRASFREWAISNGYKKGLHIDRIDNNGDYSPENCRVITPFENSLNRSDSKDDVGIETYRRLDGSKMLIVRCRPSGLKKIYRSFNNRKEALSFRDAITNNLINERRKQYV